MHRRSYITSAHISSAQAMNTSSVFIASAICITWCSGVQHLHSTRSPSLVTLALTRTSSLRITDCFFLYASPCLWKQLRQPRTGFSMSVSPFVHLSVLHVLIHHSAESIAPSVCHSWLKTNLFHNSFTLSCLGPITITRIVSSALYWFLF